MKKLENLGDLEASPLIIETTMADLDLDGNPIVIPWFEAKFPNNGGVNNNVLQERWNNEYNSDEVGVTVGCSTFDEIWISGGTMESVEFAIRTLQDLSNKIDDERGDSDIEHSMNGVRKDLLKKYGYGEDDGEFADPNADLFPNGYDEGFKGPNVSMYDDEDYRRFDINADLFPSGYPEGYFGERFKDPNKALFLKIEPLFDYKEIKKKPVKFEYETPDVFDYSIKEEPVRFEYETPPVGFDYKKIEEPVKFYDDLYGGTDEISTDENDDDAFDE